MKKSFLLLSAILMISTVSFTQTSRALKKVIELIMIPKTEGDNMLGTRGASVVWHPLQKKYYVSFAGNEGYPMAVFNAIGKRLSPDTLKTMIDTRGLWYNPIKKRICGNAYGDNGWFSYTLDSKGIPIYFMVDFENMHQPGEQSVGAYNASTKQVLFLSGSTISVYNAMAEEEEPDVKTMIHWGRTAKDGIGEDEDETEVPQGYNNSTIIYS
ncbi:MAG: hypothetical protein WCG67_09370, partial [Ferruginibacter sp.]